MEVKTQNRNDVTIGTLEGFIGVIIHPAATFTRLIAAPIIWLPGLYLSLLSLLISLPLYGKYVEYNKYLSGTLVPLQGAKSGLITGEVINLQIVAMYVSVALGPLVSSLIIAVLLKLLNMIIGEETKFSQLYAITVFGKAPTILGLLISNILLFTATGENLVRTVTTSMSLAALVPPSMVSPFVFTLLTKVGLFPIWGLILTTIGVSKAFCTSTLKVGSIIIGFWLIISLMGSLIAQDTIKQLIY